MGSLSFRHIFEKVKHLLLILQVLSGCNLFENGKIIVEDYGPNLDELSEGDRVGIMRTSEVC